jgi:hypothetical protein
MTHWIDSKVSKPRREQRVAALVEGWQHWVSAQYWAESDVWTLGGQCGYWPVTHWFPIPPEPEKK